MKEKSFAKISRPNAKGLIPRKRLFRLLSGLGKQPILWVTGPAGAGKTSLIAGYLDARKLPCLWYQVDERDSDIASFFYYLGLAAKKASPRCRKPLPLLTPEYLSGITTFTRRFFEKLYSRLKPPFAVVFDNYQDVPEQALFHGVMQNALSLVPEGIQVFILSRNEPPAVFSRLRANDLIRAVGWEELRFTLEETAQFVRRKLKRTEDGIAEDLHAKTEGWAGGVVLLAESIGENSFPALTDGNPARVEVFDYFAGEVLDKLDTETRDFLTMSSMLPQMSGRTAKKMTDCENAGAILETLSRNNFFTEKKTAPELTYQYHSLFREFLLIRMKESLSAEGLLRVQKRAAAVLEEAGQVEDAVQLFCSARDWENLARLVLMHAQSLLIQGRMQTLREWLQEVPKEVAEHHPWLLYWRAVCTLPFNPKESRQFFERSFQLFGSRGDATGSLAAWSGAVQTFLIEFHDFRPLDPWIDWIHEQLRQGVSFTSPEIEASVVAGMTGILAWRKPDLPDKQQWLDRALSLPAGPRTADARVRACTNSALYHMWMGEFSQCRFLIQEMRSMLQVHSPSPLRQIILKVTEAMLYNSHAGCHGQAAQAIREGLDIARETGVSVMSPSLFLHGAASSLNEGDAKKAGEFLEKMESSVSEDRRVNASHYFFMAAWCELFAGRSERAVDFSKKSLQMIEMAGVPTNEALIRLVLAHGLYETADYAGTRRQLDTIRDLILRSGSAYAAYLYHLTEAYCALGKGDRSLGHAALVSAMRTGRKGGFATMLYFWRPSVWSDLCAEALEAGIEVEYAQSLIAKLNLVPGVRAREIKTWPWPLRITTLGRFEVQLDGKRLGPGRKVQHKPLMLLKALIALGGSEVPEEKTTDLLWPDSDGDAAHSAFSTTLQRLRALVGNDQALLVDERRLSLDQRFCWVDAWSFERMHERAESLWRTANEQSGRKRASAAEDACRHGEKALELYLGSFLPGDSGEAWTAAYRERLRSKFLRLVLQQGLYLEESAQWRKAVETFEQGLETDELAEEFYQHLMICYHKLGQKAEAIRVYENCRAVLFSAYEISPSKQTETLYSSLLK